MQELMAIESRILGEQVYNSRRALFLRRACIQQ